MNWISVEDKLPLLLHKVLFHWIYLQGGIDNNISMGYLTGENYGGWDIYLPCSSYPLDRNYIKVTHWMELPEYPK